MIKALGLVPRRANISPQQFHLHWAIIHSRLAEEVQSIRHYVQFHGTTENPGTFTRSIYEGIAEAWLEDVPSLTSLAADPYFMEVIKRDEENFLDHSRDGILAVTEDVKLEGPTLTRDHPFHKTMLLVKRTPDVGTTKFRTWWNDVLPDLALREIPGVTRYVQSLPVDEMYTAEQPAFDAVIEIWRGDPASPESEAPSLDKFAAVLGANSPIDISHTSAIVGTEFRIR
ncbi:EthD domain-containing protein [Streptomyces kunmingensis]|uniref:EthD domain-containing protein n=1 Tax=Streptomyces kunmingensis TaxID=68225 RepID=A0ABU6C976_9ACTN|nr:EthD domain-containing protein [Streptomyces kunmingensis]MEB3960741.1 EthD domain-containing protein [Streptomyces kunmingensis]